jgi:hypothetical protein
MASKQTSKAARDARASDQERKPRKVLLQLTDQEWRSLKVDAVHSDESVQALVTAAVLRDMHHRHRRSPERWPARAR